jgi:aspartate aminotransferase-like enzyme
MLPPGLAFLTASDRAWSRTEKSDLPKYYLNLNKERKKQQGGQTAWTTPTALVLGLVHALQMMNEEGIDKIHQRHHTLSEACRAAAQAVGLGLLAEDAPSRALTAVHCGENLDAGAVIKGLREGFGIPVAGGQEHLKGRIFRIGHLGWVDGGDILRTVSAMERVLSNIGHPFERGAGLQAAEEKLRALNL